MHNILIVKDNELYAKVMSQAIVKNHSTKFEGSSNQ